MFNFTIKQLYLQEKIFYFSLFKTKKNTPQCVLFDRPVGFEPTCHSIYMRNTG